ncbi:putative ga4 desaturase protein [Seiridium cardinale]|uniref:Ga4 desaturase protein n=1 Tax=Seiridium cardinale TaxID=138064 RepID=A0ABR2XTP6_9PEZI
MTTATITEHKSKVAPRQLGKFNYLAKGDRAIPNPNNFHLPALSSLRDERLLPLNSLRPLPTVTQLRERKGMAHLETHGFTALYHPATLHSSPYDVASWKDPELLLKYYAPETQAMLKDITGCKKVIPDAFLLRSNTFNEKTVSLATHAGHGEGSDTAENKAITELETGFPQFLGFDPVKGGAGPSLKVHMDYKPEGARSHIRNIHPSLAEASRDIILAEDEILASGGTLRDSYIDSTGPRWACYSVWRPLKTVRRNPLVMGDQRSIQQEDYESVSVKTPCLGRPGIIETHDAPGYVARYSEGHTWYWVDAQKPEEVLVIGLFDSHAEKYGGKASGGTLHCSTELPGTEEEEARQSLELRCLCIW